MAEADKTESPRASCLSELLGSFASEFSTWRLTIMDPKIGDRVRATMNGIDWFEGELKEESDIFAQYGVLCDDFNEIRFFITAEKL